MDWQLNFTSQESRNFLRAGIYIEFCHMKRLERGKIKLLIYRTEGIPRQFSATLFDDFAFLVVRSHVTSSSS